ncbi:MarR family transcriptional regulator [Belnapia sp. T6]|uniref:MarR family transcriptional regulator n=1 Tax=Belnapia mucosa TaxID=2804532 RepID=A0ABS1VCM8_9PROT|nr:MarR family transcriptional regulator [Belnapia mucosa]
MRPNPAPTRYAAGRLPDRRAATARSLATYLRINKPAATRGLDRLEELNLVRLEIDCRDRRSIIAGRTAAGAAMVERLKAALTQSLAPTPMLSASQNGSGSG